MFNMNDKQNDSLYGNFILGTLCLALFVPNFGQYLLSPFAVEIMEDYQISSSQFSSLFTAPMVPAVFLSLAAGILVDRFSGKITVGAALAATTVGSILSLYASTYEMLFISFAMVGVTAATLNGTQAKLLGEWFPVESVSSKTGIVLSFSTIAMTIALAIAAYFPSRKIAFSVTTGLAILALITWILFYRDRKKSKESKKDSLDNLKIVVKNPYIWFIAFCLFFLMAANVVMSSFLPTILMSRNIPSKTAGYYSSIYMVGSFVSCYLAPLMVQKFKNFKKVTLLFSMVGAIGAAFSAAYAPEGFVLGITILVTGIGIGGNLPILMALPVSLKGIGVSLAGTAGGLIATIQLLGAIILPGNVLIPIAGEGNYSGLFFLAGICMLICGGLSMLLPQELGNAKSI